MSDGVVTAEAEAPIEELLAPLLQGDFILTDGHGAVSRWESNAARLFGRRSDEVVGRSIFDALLASGGGEWRRHLDGEGPQPMPALEATARRGDGSEFDVELLILPVPMSRSVDASRLLQAMGSDLSPADRLARLEHEHPSVLDCFTAAARGEERTEERLAGLIVTFSAPDEVLPPEPEPEPVPAAPVVGPTEDSLLRVGELEREVAALREEVAATLALAEQALALSEESHLHGERHRHEFSQGADASTFKGEVRERPHLDGFDDSPQPKALIGLDGHFDFLNEEFEALVGYPEWAFRRARWPSIVDREKLVEHRAVMAALTAGDFDEARVETVYLHGQGLLVPLAGTLELIRAEDGSPSQVLLTVDA